MGGVNLKSSILSLPVMVMWCGAAYTYANFGACETTGLCHFLHFEKASSPAENSEHYHCILQSSLRGKVFYICCGYRLYVGPL